MEGFKLNKLKYLVIFIALVGMIAPIFVLSEKVKGEFFNKSENNSQSDSEIKIQQKTEKIKLLFVGDMMFDRYIRQVSEKKHDLCYPFEKIGAFMNEFDAVVGNNEGPITGNSSVSAIATASDAQQMTFTFDPKITDCYLQNNLKIIGIGNNHIMNFGKDGVRETVEYLKKAGIEYFGNPLDPNENFLIKEIKGRKIAIVAYNYAWGLSSDEVAAQISKVRKNVDDVIIFAHWGREYDLQNNSTQQLLAYKFIDAGADVIFGMHPHVVQNEEVYKGKHIFYSLGNFIFDQYFQSETQKGIGIQMEIDENNKLEFKKYDFLIPSTVQVKVT